MRKLFTYLLCIMGVILILGNVDAEPPVQSEVRPAGATGTVIIPDHFLAALGSGDHFLYP